MKTHAKELDFEVNLLPFLSVLSICICFLLTSTVWNRMGFIGVNQAIGDELPSTGANPDMVIFKVQTSGHYLMQWRRGSDSSTASEKRIPMQPNKSWTAEAIKKEIFDFVKVSKIKTVIVMPEIGVKYGQTIALLDQLKALSVSVGLAPAVKSTTVAGGAR